MIVRNVSTDCTHCGLPVPAGLIESERDEQFCCNGCAMAYQLISASGLDAFYAMVDSSGADQTLRSRSESAVQFEPFDDAAFLEKFAIVTSAGWMEITLALDGIHCAACVWLVEKLPGILPGVVSAQVNWSRGTILVRWQPAQVRLSQIATALYRLGYTPHPMRISEKSVRRERENRQYLVRIGIAAAAAGNNMLITAALYLGMFSSMESGFVWLLRWASCLVGLGSLLGPGRVFLRGAWSAIRTGTPHMDLPIALGLAVGTSAGLVNTIRGTGDIYFDSLSVLIFLLLVGRWIQFHQQNRAADSIELLYRLTPQRARKIVDGTSTEVIVDEIKVDDLLEIRPGDLVPVDGIVVEGHSSIDESLLSGESKPAEKCLGDMVSAGTKNLGSLLLARATHVGQQTRISRIVELVEQASTDKPELVQWANRIGGYFVVTIIVLAVMTFAIWMFIDPSVATDRAVALLIVACPCALALATPLAISVALGRMAKRGIMVKAGDVIQALDRPGMIWLDKTGTLTEGEMRVVDWAGDRDWISRVAVVESKFSHPISQAMVEFARVSQRPGKPPVASGTVPRETESPNGLPSDRIEKTLMLSGGVSATVDGIEILIGNRGLLESSGVKLSDQWLALESRSLDRQLSPCWIVANNEVVGLASLGDRIREDASEVVVNLQAGGWSVGILSGDHPAVVDEVARQLKIESVRGGATPEEKLSVIRESGKRFATTVMVGDGVNDSAALAAATVGIAVHNGAEASLAAAPVYLGNSGLAPIEHLLSASQSTCRTIRRNFAASLAYNVLGAGLAMMGLIHPLVAAILMPISSLTVIAISLRAGRN
jgi:Cu2+-exporting ATPase